MNKIFCGDVLEVLKTLKSESVHMVCTSPPYWGLRDYGMAGQIGLEKTPEEYVAKMVEVFREVRRVLHDDGTLWLNLGDSYTSGGRGSYPNADQLNGCKQSTSRAWNDEDSPIKVPRNPKIPSGLKPKDLCGIPWRVAFALQADGWYLRSDIIWHKPNPMPESVTDRPTKSHEYIFLLSKSKNYFYDAEAIKEESVTDEDSSASMMFGSVNGKNNTSEKAHAADLGHKWEYSAMRNKRSVWTIVTNPYPDAHFATFPEDLVIPCIKAGSPEFVCDKCGEPKITTIEKEFVGDSHKRKLPSHKDYNAHILNTNTGNGMKIAKEIGRTISDCGCNSKLQPGIVLDPFSGAGTTCMVAKKLNRQYIGIEINPKYVELAEKRIEIECGTLF